MNRNFLLSLLALCLLLVLPACDSTGRGAGDDDDASDDDDDDDDVVSVGLEVDWPFLEMAEAWAGGDLIFPTNLAHLMGETVSTAWWSADFASIRIQNTGSTTVTLEVSAELVGYSDEDTTVVSLSPGGVEWLVLNPAPSISELYVLDAMTNGQARVEIRNTATDGLVAEQSESVRVASRGDVFWKLGGLDSLDAAVPLVRPAASEVQALHAAMQSASWFGTSAGVGGYRAEAGTAVWPQRSHTVSAGAEKSWSMFIEEGRTVGFSADSDGADTRLFLMSFDDGVTTTFYDENISTMHSGTFTAPSTGYYYLIAHNYSTFFSEDVTWQRTMTRADNVQDYLQMIYNYLQDEGMNYANVASTFFDSAQQVLLPEEMIANNGGNCIDGTLLFASLLERMDVRPVIMFPPGHAYIGVVSAPVGEGIIWPLETTSMGSGTDFVDALNCGITGCVSGVASEKVFIDAARDLGLTQMPQ